MHFDLKWYGIQEKIISFLYSPNTIFTIAHKYAFNFCPILYIYLAIMGGIIIVSISFDVSILTMPSEIEAMKYDLNEINHVYIVFYVMWCSLVKQ